MKSKQEPIRAFISYSTRDKRPAGLIRAEIETYGIKVFLAHEDIESSARWRRKILDELNQADVFIPILTKNFKTSDWTNQESGFSIARKILIAPLWASIKPYGFLEDYQAVHIKLKKPQDACRQIIQGISENRWLGKRLIDGFLDVFLKSENYITSNNLSEKLTLLPDFEPSQLARFVHGVYTNNQIYNAHAQYFVVNFLHEYKSSMSTASWKKLSKRYRL